MTNTPLVSDFTDPPPNPETPWEFLPDDDVRDELAQEERPPAEADAMHVETAPPRLDQDGRSDRTGSTEEGGTVVHYFADEHPEIPDTSEPRPASDETAEVEDLLIRQHYLPPDDETDDGD